MISFNIQAGREDEFSYRLGNIMRAAQRGIVDPQYGTLTVQARLLTERCIALTPPRNRAQGKNAVMRDFYRAVGVLDQDSFSRAVEHVRVPMRELIRRKDNETLQQALREMDGNNWIVKKFDPQDHISRRDNRGRVNRKSFVMTTDSVKARRYMRGLVKSVGWAKAGWMVAYRWLAGNRAAEWYAKHAFAPGYFMRGGSGATAFIEVRNLTAWGKKNDQSSRVVQTAMRSRAQAMKTYLHKMMELAATGTPTPYQMQQSQIESQFTDAA